MDPLVNTGFQTDNFGEILILAANFVMLPYYTFNYLVNSSADGSRSPLADNSLLILLVLIHYRKCVSMDDSVNNYAAADAAPNVPSKDSSYFSINPYCKALENARDIECDIFALFIETIYFPLPFCLFLKNILLQLIV